MQQIEKYKLNLIERSEPFLPDALNANTQKIEDVLEAHKTAAYRSKISTATDI